MLSSFSSVCAHCFGPPMIYSIVLTHIRLKPITSSLLFFTYMTPSTCKSVLGVSVSVGNPKHTVVIVIDVTIRNNVAHIVVVEVRRAPAGTKNYKIEAEDITIRFHKLSIAVATIESRRAKVKNFLDNNASVGICHSPISIPMTIIRYKSAIFDKTCIIEAIQIRREKRCP